MISRSPASSQQLARETRERFVAATEGAIAPIALAVRERLAALAGMTTSVREMQQHRDDYLAFQAQGSSWVPMSQAAWRKALGGGVPSGSTGGLRLELIGDEVVETNILSSRLAQSIQDKAQFELNDLRLRIQFLEGTAELDAKDVLKPEALARTLVDQWLAAGLSRETWARVQDVVQRRLVDAVVAAYKDANTFLIERGVMPEIDLKSFVKRTGSAGSNSVPLGGSFARPSQPGSASFGMGGGQAVPGAFGAPPGSFAPAAIGVGAGRGSGTAGGDTLVATGGSPLVLARQRAQGVLLNLKRFVTARIGGDLGQMRMPGAQAPGAGAPGGSGVRGGGVGLAAPAFAAAIADAEAAYQAMASQYVVGDEATAMHQTAAELRRRTSELKKKAPTTADKATVEIVALMFQAILAEERIPFSARVWFARLQMPVLRVAIAEPEFFGTLQHPARMLIDRMGSCVMGFDAAAISGSALEGEIRRVVQVIEQYPETGQRVFKLVFDEFVAFLNKYLTQSDATQRVMSVAQQVEQKETMAIQYTIELRKMLNDMPVREEIREFLFKIWAEVLAIAALRYGAQDEKTVTLKRAASDLVWAASAKPNRNDRARVIQDLPQLLQRLRQGMSLLGIEGEPQEAQIKIIGSTLSDAFLSKTEAIPPAKIEAMAKRLANLEDFVTDEGDATDLPLDAASIELLLGVDAASLEVVPDTGTKVGEDMLQWAHELQVGTWFMLDHNDRVSQVQFVWRSERKQLHLFASSDGRSFLIQVGRLASYLQAGLLVPAEEETLTVRATREALAKLDANPERLLN
ncbi:MULTISPECIES: DUF1631 family protein [unclassified Variovorax]|uniref:DUF1631 family protein n=1 Tax=unclassified Variovorax TaxID=663243 RepID=UPI00076BF8FA|nr:MULTISPECIES: DUF1631 family protein [unclassified Variovorax]KWT85679.1 Thymidine phosphorylase [Variovorax sp. WDL1]PNG58308.1 hypothetical protein CHC07_00032 [Variovorax sp. B4]PNG61902.1 hypothetical protein CHC06_01804 [Variovorax sp. B2]VTV12022.1 hypothetical protein WDL1CHR_02860 [Variovorax sp. WDL1]